MKPPAKPKQRPAVPARLPSIHPGRILRKEILEVSGITQTQLATAPGLPVSRINDLIKERRGITVDRVIRLGKALGTSHGALAQSATCLRSRRSRKGKRHRIPADQAAAAEGGLADVCRIVQLACSRS